ncbi:hypothetical protein OS493_027609 [Desmophyllum pertusum]|uniref:Uncharacterized protein n=1 Tax=Desmophyllum pertusum TaxID=174260 RepID=A0A9W9ZL55_9CNID|nr:hypothetical protein OS493_027609 [Desmophyllum pertusum]
MGLDLADPWGLSSLPGRRHWTAAPDRVDVDIMGLTVAGNGDLEATRKVQHMHNGLGNSAEFKTVFRIRRHWTAAPDRKIVTVSRAQPPVTFTAVNAKIANIGEDVLFKAKFDDADKFIAVEVCRATPGDDFHSPGISVIPILAGGAVLLLLVAVGLFIFYRKRQRRHKRRNTLIHNEEGLSDIERSFDHDDTTVFDEISETLEPQLSDETDSCTILERRKLFLNMDWTIV